MSVTVVGHVHAPPLRLPPIGEPTVQLIIQTGTILTTFGLAEADPIIDTHGHQHPDPDGWHRDQLRMQVLELSHFDISNTELTAVATASPASIEYLPMGVEKGVGTGLFAKGHVVLFKQTDDPPDRFSGNVSLPVEGSGMRFSTRPGGWAVDRAVAEFEGRHVILIADLAARKSSLIHRIAYTLFVTITRSDIIKLHP